MPSQPLESSPAEDMSKGVSDVASEQVTNSDNPPPTETIYTQNSIWGGSFLGGPLVAGYIIARNFKAFNESPKAWVTWIVTICASAVILGAAFLLSDTNWRGIPIAYTAIAYGLIRHYQGAKIDAHIKAGGATHGYLNIIGVSLAGLIITFIPIIVIAIAVESINPTETQQSFTERDILESPAVREYQSLKHKIYFLRSNISVEEIDKLAAGLTKTGFFNEASRRQVYVRKVKDTYEVSIPCTSVITTDPDAYREFIPLRNDMQQLFPRNKIILNLVLESLDNVVKRIE
ncbi:MAG TPA: hypothetical protein VJP89_01320 [Pyrinomonadaceae bacterium]|nr:hypothetical protein [Pyrinomonadaceae bacterium]